MKLLIGLGNPGTEFQHNRHNTGFLFLDYLIHQIDPNSRFNNQGKLEALSCQIVINKKQLLLLKPQTFMNNSGLAVIKTVNYYHLNIENDLMLIHDDLDLNLGEYKIQFSKGPHVHNGINSVTSSLGSSNFWRVRIGIAGESYQEIKDKQLAVAENYILKDFSKSELKQLEMVFSGIVPELKTLLNKL